MKRLLYILTTVLLTGATASGQTTLLVENFDYPVGTILTTQNWLAHSSGGTNPVLVTSPGLQFTGYIGSAIGLAAGVNNTGEDINKRFDPQSAAGPVYAAFLVRASASVVPGVDGADPRPYFFHFFDPDLSTSHRGRVFIANGTQTGKMNVGLSFNGNAAQTTMPTDLNFNETYLFVLKYTIVDGTLNDNVSLYVFPAGTDFVSEPATPTLGPVSTTSTSGDITVVGVALRQFNAEQRITVDGIRVSREWGIATGTTSDVNIHDNPQMVVFPNPVNDGRITIPGLTGLEKKIEVFSITGVKVLELNTGDDVIDLSGIESGLYYLKVQGGGMTLSSKVVIR
ncbi:MAG: T9SS type A sorting domain-containing protein [Bacteroidales bacterium]|nr:T9SS type A sorting domain-containing protein [Bacteroidales bacterium]